MQYPKLKPRPMALKICRSLRGLDRRPGAAGRTYNDSWQWYWHDEENLSSDRFPRLSVRKARGRVVDVDGNCVGPDRIIGMCGGDHALILDATGTLWCNGNQIGLAGEGGIDYFWEIRRNTDRKRGRPAPVYLTPSSDGTGAIPDADLIQTALWDAWEGHFGMATLVYDPAGAPAAAHWHWVEGDQWFTLVQLGLMATQLPQQGDSYTVRYETGCVFGAQPQIVRMGAYAVIYPGLVWCNAVKLAAGEELVAGEDYGSCAGALYNDDQSLTLTLCDIDGKPYNGVTVSSTPPQVQSGYWLNTGGSKAELMEWSVAVSGWAAVSSTFVRIENWLRDPYQDTIRKGDGVKLEADCAAGTDEAVAELLNKDHYIYGAEIDENSGGWILVAGILPSDSVTVNLEDVAWVRREIPQMDYVVEAQNRLWGCRYSEADGLNEIYGSKLGDFRNWSVYQGLSTDSWTASRGIAAPFTGAVSLGGHPLFFREEWLEKVFPSSYGGHQIAVQSLEGVQEGSAGSMVVIDERLFYKSRLGVCVYSGSLPARISDNFGDWTFQRATAARHLRKYVVCMTRTGDLEKVCMVYDLATGDWHPEDEVWDGSAITWKDRCYYVMDGLLYAFDAGNTPSEVEWYAESDELSLELPEHKWIYEIRLRFQLEIDAACRIYISYDGGPWLRKAGLKGNRLHSREISIWPQRCDHFRLRLEGKGGFELQSISYRVERSQGGT